MGGVDDEVTAFDMPAKPTKAKDAIVEATATKATPCARSPVVAFESGASVTAGSSSMAGTMAASMSA
jgi:hypothetical protein